jgi:hypothetical protein
VQGGSIQHNYQVGDSVLADMNGTRVPGVIEATDGDRLHVRLSQPWVDENGSQTDIAVLATNQVEPVLGENAPSELTG